MIKSIDSSSNGSFSASMLTENGFIPFSFRLASFHEPKSIPNKSAFGFDCLTIFRSLPSPQPISMHLSIFKFFNQFSKTYLPYDSLWSTIVNLDVEPGITFLIIIAFIYPFLSFAFMYFSAAAFHSSVFGRFIATNYWLSEVRVLLVFGCR